MTNIKGDPKRILEVPISSEHLGWVVYILLFICLHKNKSNGHKSSNTIAHSKASQRICVPAFWSFKTNIEGNLYASSKFLST